MKNNGFSLIELSIVLVILGLLTGGILTGQSLIRSSELRAVITESEQFTAAIHTFKEKYFALPGDMPNATSYWGRADDGTFSGQCADPDNNTGTAPRTCNGNGDGKITPGSSEPFRTWQHLTNAGLIQGVFTGIAGSGGSLYHIIDENCPSSAFSGGGWSLFTADRALGWNDGGNWYATADNKLLLQIGAELENYETASPLFTTEEAWGIDKKKDDGKPGMGKIITQNSNYVPCATSINQLTAEYDLTYKEVTCQLLFLLD